MTVCQQPLASVPECQIISVSANGQTAGDTSQRAVKAYPMVSEDLASILRCCTGLAVSLGLTPCGIHTADQGRCHIGHRQCICTYNTGVEDKGAHVVICIKRCQALTLSWCMEKATFDGSSTAPAMTWCSKLYLSRYACTSKDMPF